jgi:hypothetical protein
VLQLPKALTADEFLDGYWQKTPLFMPQAVDSLRPSISRNELAWLATCDDVESRIVFCDRQHAQTRYRAETGPFDEAFLRALPARDWTLLVHDVEKHLPAMRRLFALVPFVPDWRIDDLMVSFAAPGGGVGPHRDNYDVFLCQGIGVREWRFTTKDVADNQSASDELRLTAEFDGDACHAARQGDVLYLPPGVAHWGTATRACMTYSIGMRAPDWYADADLTSSEAQPGYLSPQALRRAGHRADELGLSATQTKEWLRPDAPTGDDIRHLLDSPALLRRLTLHGMARLAFDDSRIYLNGITRSGVDSDLECLRELCARRRLDQRLLNIITPELLTWLLANGAFETP